MKMLARAVLSAIVLTVSATACPSPTKPAAQHHVPTFSCGDDLRGLDDVAGAGRVLLLGELHGTYEIPAFAAELACQAAHRYMDVQLGLEIPGIEQPAVDAYLA